MQHTPPADREAPSRRSRRNGPKTRPGVGRRAVRRPQAAAWTGGDRDDRRSNSCTTFTGSRNSATPSNARRCRHRRHRHHPLRAPQGMSRPSPAPWAVRGPRAPRYVPSCTGRTPPIPHGREEALQEETAPRALSDGSRWPNSSSALRALRFWTTKTSGATRACGVPSSYWINRSPDT